MDFLLGLLFWGGLLALTLLWIARTGLTGNRTHRPPRSHDPQQPRPASPSAWSTTAPPGHTPPARHDPRRRKTEAQRLREDEAIADGLVIGGYGVEPWADDLFDHDDED